MQVNGALSIIWALAIECKNITEQIIYSCRSQSPTGRSFSDTLLQKEILKLKNFHEKLLLAVMFLSHKKSVKFIHVFWWVKLSEPLYLHLFSDQRKILWNERSLSSSISDAEYQPVCGRNSAGYFQTWRNHCISGHFSIAVRISIHILQRRVESCKWFFTLIYLSFFYFSSWFWLLIFTFLLIDRVRPSVVWRIWKRSPTSAGCSSKSAILFSAKNWTTASTPWIS